MKKLILISMTLLLVTACREEAVSQDLNPITITLNVNAGKLYSEDDYPPSAVMDYYCTLNDGDSTSKPGRLKEFETKVAVGQKIIWEVEESTSNDYDVTIQSIVYTPRQKIGIYKNVNFFENIALTENEQGKFEGEVKAGIKKNSMHHYMIYFQIKNKNEGVYKGYLIDPRLKYE